MNKKTIVQNILKTLIIPVAIYLIMFICSGGRFGGSASMLLMLRQSAIPLLIAMAIGFNMMMGMWDFSAGAVVYAGVLIGCKLAEITGTGVAGMAMFCILVAIGLSTLTGLLYRLIKIPIVVLTIGTTILYEGLPKIFGITNIKIASSDTILAMAPWCFIILIAGGITFHIMYYKTSFGNNVMAIGSDQQIARNAGINVEKTKFLSFVWSGVLLGIASVLYISNVTSLVPVSGFASSTLVFDAMMGCFIAFFLMRYCNFTIGIVVGIISMQMLMFGLLSMGLGSTMRIVVQGIFLLVLLIFSSNQSRIEDSRNRKRLMVEANRKYQLMQKAKTVDS